jgi:hypothetical protein
MGQAQLARFRNVRVLTTVVSAAPTDGSGGTAPHLTLSPLAPSGLPTTGFIFMLKAPSAGSATAGAGGFTVTFWFLDPVSLRWGSATAVSVAYGQMFVSFDVDAIPVYMQITNVAVDGSIDLHLAEQ